MDKAPASHSCGLGVKSQSEGVMLRKQYNRQVVEKTDFRLSQTLEVVEFLKSHPFLNSELIACEGSSIRVAIQ